MLFDWINWKVFELSAESKSYSSSKLEVPAPYVSSVKCKIHGWFMQIFTVKRPSHRQCMQIFIIIELICCEIHHQTRKHMVWVVDLSSLVAVYSPTHQGAANISPLLHPQQQQQQAPISPSQQHISTQQSQQQQSVPAQCTAPPPPPTCTPPQQNTPPLRQHNPVRRAYSVDGKLLGY